jgi:GT2 family glycosyltransferase
MQNFVSFVIVTYKRHTEALAAVQSILSQKGDLELILIDNNPDATLKSLLPDDERIKHLQQNCNRGYVWARNHAVEIAQGDIIVFLDDDAEIQSENVVENLIAHFKNNPHAACIAFQIRNYYTQTIVPKEFPHPDLKISDRKSLVSYYVGAGHAFRSEIVRSLGTFLDMNYGGEELEYSFRLINNGYQIIYVPDVIVLHKAAIGGRHSYGKNIYYSVRNRLWLTARYLPIYYFLINNFLWSLIWFMRAFKSMTLYYYLYGNLDGIGKCVQVFQNKQRHPLSKQAISYLKQNGGRLWL